MRGLGWVAVWTAATSIAAGIDLEALVPGTRGVMRTALVGQQIEEIPLEILGVMPDRSGPGHDVVIARLLGERVESIGVAGGMSGSPVYVDGELIGAVAYRIGRMTSEAIAGITPIDDVLAAGDDAHASTPHPSAIVHDTGGSLEPLAVPLMRSGVPSFAVEMLGDGWIDYDADADAGVGAAVESASLEPGSPVGFQLIRGDVGLAASGTVTRVEGDRVYALGHPLTGLGEIELPLCTASVVHTVPSAVGSFKLTRVGSPIGTLLQDRLTGVVGRLGTEPNLLPVTLELRDGAERRTLAVELARHPRLTPGLLRTAAASALVQRVGFSAEAALSARVAIELEGRDPVHVSRPYPAGVPDAGRVLATELGELLAEIVDNPFTAVRVESIDVRVDVLGGAGPSRVERVRADRGLVRPGESTTVTVDLRTAAGDLRVVRTELQMPVGRRTGEIEVVVGDPDHLERTLPSAYRKRADHAASLDELLRAIERRRAPGQLYLVAFRPTDGLMVGSVALADLPPSAVSVRRPAGSGRELDRALIVDRALPGAAPATGGGSFTLEVR